MSDLPKCEYKTHPDGRSCLIQATEFFMWAPQWRVSFSGSEVQAFCKEHQHIREKKSVWKRITKEEYFVAEVLLK